MTFLDTSKAAGYAAQADKAAQRALQLVEQGLDALRRTNDVRVQTETLLKQLHISFRWIGTRLDLMGPDGNWVEGPDLRGAVSTAGGATAGHLAVFADGSGDLLEDGGALTASIVPFAPAGQLSATTVQGALIELEAEKAPIDAPEFTGLAKAPTPALADNSQRLATTAFVKGIVDQLVNGAGAALDQLNEISAALNNDPNFAATMLTALGGKQASHANLTALSGLVGAGSKVPVFTGAGSMALLSYGVAANALLQIGADGKLPVIDGSNVFNLSVAAKAPLASKATNYTVLVSDAGKLFDCTASLTLSLTAAATLGDGFTFYVRVANLDTAVTLDPNGAELIDGLATARGYAGDNVFTVICDGTSFRTTRRRGPVLMGRSVISTPVATLDREFGFDDPEMASIQFQGDGLSHNYTTSQAAISGRVKKGGSYLTSNYLSRSLTVSSGGSAGGAANTSEVKLTNIFTDTKQVSCTVECLFPQSSSNSTQVVRASAMDNDIPTYGTWNDTFCMINQTGVMQGFRFFPSNGSLDSGTVTQYGVRA